MATVAYTPDGADHGTAGDSLHRQFVSSALTAGTVFSVGNTLKLAVQGLEAHANNNLNVQLWVGVYSSSHALQQTLRGKVEQATELATSLTNRFLSTTVANAYTTVTGDYLVVEISVEGSPGGGGGVQGHNASLRWGSDGGSGDLPENDTETGTGFNPWFEIQTTDPATPTRGRVSFAEFETPFVSTRGRVSFAEFEVPLVSTRGRLSWAELEAPITLTRGRVAWTELQVPDEIAATPTRGQVSWVEFETPLVPTRGQLSWTEFEVPLSPTRGQVSWAEFETLLAPTRGRVSFAEFELPLAPTRGQISWAELAIEDAVAQVTGRRSRHANFGGKANFR